MRYCYCCCCCLLAQLPIVYGSQIDIIPEITELFMQSPGNGIAIEISWFGLIWASTQENLSLGFANSKGTDTQTDPRLCY